MKKKTVYFLAFMTFLLSSCGPRYSGEEIPATGTLMLGFLKDHDSSLEHSLAVFDIDDVRLCQDGKGDASVVFTVIAADESDAKVISCKWIDFPSPSEIAGTLSGEGYLDSSPIPIPGPREPLVSSVQRRTILSDQGHLIYYLAYSESCVQIVKGSYGNRQGSESEYTYCIEKEGLEIVSSTMRIVDLEMFSGF